MQSKSFAIRDSFKNLMITLGRRIVFFKLTKFVSKGGATTRAKVDELDGIPKKEHLRQNTVFTRQSLELANTC